MELATLARHFSLIFWTQIGRGSQRSPQISSPGTDVDMAIEAA
jgi:hypothetical protein